MLQLNMIRGNVNSNVRKGMIINRLKEKYKIIIMGRI